MTKNLIESSDQQADGSGAPEEKELSLTARRALEIFIDPQAKDKTLQDIATELGITTRGLYKIRKDARFNEELKAALKRMIQRNLAAIVQATIDSALIVGKNGHNDRKLILNLAELVDATGKKKEPDEPSQTKDVDFGERLRGSERRRVLLLAQADVLEMETSNDGIPEADFDVVEDDESEAV